MYNILKPIQIGSITLKNRICYLGMSKASENPDNTVSEGSIAYYTNLAKNGVALITTGACLVFDEYPEHLLFQVGLYDDKFIPGIRKLTDSVHQYGAKLFLQPWHPGLNGHNAPADQLKGPADFSVEEIHQMQDRFVDAILRAKRAGADGVEWHMAHNYLPEQFAVSAYNKRTDEYGADTVENASRFSAEIVRKAHAVCGEDFPISLKVNAWDMGIEGGMTPEWCAGICQEMEKAGVCMITVSAGGGMTDITGMSGDGYRKEGWKIGYAETVKKAVSVPVMASGNIRHLDVMEQAIENGQCDLIGMGRGLVAEPEFVKKVSEGREDELRYCMSCMNCFMPMLDPNGQHCSLNPTAHREYLVKDLPVDGDGRTVVVVGAGLAGLNAAIVLAQRGFKPVVLEKSSFICGSLRYASAPDGKSKLKWAYSYYHTMLEKLHIPVHLNTEATAESIRAMDPYAVFVATGGKPIVPGSIPGIHGDNVILAKDCLDREMAYANEDVIVIGGGMVGLEIATTYQHHGSKATVVEMMTMDQIPPAITTVLALQHAMQAGVNLRYGNKLAEVTPDGVIVENTEGSRSEIKGSRVVLCMGFTPDNKLYDELSATMERVYKMGDANKVDNLARATREGYLAAVNL